MLGNLDALSHDNRVFGSVQWRDHSSIPDSDRAPSPLSFLVQLAVSCAAQAQVCDTLEVVARLLWGDSGAARQCYSRDPTQNLATLVDAEKLHGAGEFLCRLEPDIP